MSAGMVFKIVGAAFIAVGLVFVTITVCLYRSDARRTAKASGTVVAVQERWNHDEGAFYYPVVAFTDANGQAHEFRSSSGTGIAPLVGETVPVVFDPVIPRDAALASDRWTIGLMGGLGSFFALLGAGLIAGMRWARRSFAAWWMS